MGPTRRSVVRRGVAATLALTADALGLPPVTAQEPAAKITIRPAVALPGMLVRVDGQGFPPGVLGRLVWKNTGARLGSFKANAAGGFRRTVAIPDAVPEDRAYPLVAAAGRGYARALVDVRLPLGPPVAIGAFIEGAPGDPTKLDAFAAKVGRPAAVSLWFQQWGLPATRDFDRSLLEAATSRGAVPLITWEPWNPNAGNANPFPLEEIAAGAFDAYVDSWAAGLRDSGRRVLLRWGHEMNGDWYPWAAGGSGGNDPAAYVAAWRHLRQRFDAAGAANVEWVWSPNVDYPGAAALVPLYPGDDVVDWIGLDGYNFGGAAWRSFATIFGPTLAQLPGLSVGSGAKPVIIAETASAEAGGNKAVWIGQALLNDLPLAFPQVRSLVWFDANKERDWRVNSSAAARTAFARAVRIPYYGGSLATVASGRRAAGEEPDRGERGQARRPKRRADGASPPAAEAARDPGRRRRARR